MADRLGTSRSSNFRSADAVVMKLMNFRSLDEDYPGEGLSAAGHGDRLVWEELAQDRVDLRLLARAIDRAYQHNLANLASAVDDVEGAVEGGILLRLHMQRERNGRLANVKKQRALKQFGCLACEVCGFDFHKAYGERGKGHIECHHIRPLHSLTPGSKTRLEDLALVCANCHLMLHGARPWPTIAQLKAVLQPPS
jgi:5-methylcytosine-specific restriction protein A